MLDRLPGDRTRFLLRSTLHLEPWWVTAFYLAVIVPADFVMARFVMARQMLHGVRARAEATTAEDLAAVR